MIGLIRSNQAEICIFVYFLLVGENKEDFLKMSQEDYFCCKNLLVSITIVFGKAPDINMYAVH